MATIRAAGKQYLALVGSIYSNNSSVSSKLIIIDVSSNNRILKAIVDTGAQQTVVDAHAVQAAGWAIEKQPVQTDNTYNVKVLSNSILR